MWSGMRWSEVQYRGVGQNESFWERFIGAVSDEKWSESLSEFMIGGRVPLQETVRSAVLLGCFYLLYMYSNLSRVHCC